MFVLSKAGKDKWNFEFDDGHSYALRETVGTEKLGVVMDVYPQRWGGYRGVVGREHEEKITITVMPPFRYFEGESVAFGLFPDEKYWTVYCWQGRVAKVDIRRRWLLWRFFSVYLDNETFRFWEAMRGPRLETPFTIALMCFEARVFKSMDGRTIGGNVAGFRQV